MSMKSKVYAALSGAVVLLILIQFVPFGRNHTNPQIATEPKWDSPRTRELFFKSCRDCHSNETRWPAYSNFAPASWLVQSDVNEGRSKLNVSDWNGASANNGFKAASEVRDGEMPPWFYLPAHPEARLTAAEKEELLQGLIATFGDEKK
jgi:hypothetical protein